MQQQSRAPARLLAAMQLPAVAQTCVVCGMLCCMRHIHRCQFCYLTSLHSVQFPCVCVLWWLLPPARAVLGRLHVPSCSDRANSGDAMAVQH